MTHAAKSHDAIEILQDMRDRLNLVLEAEEARRQTLHAEIVKANAIALLRKIAKQHRTSDSDRKAAEALAEQLGRVA